MACKSIWPLSLLLGLCALTFFLGHVAPGDPARIILGPTATEESVATLRTEMGLDRPITVQFVGFLKEALSGQWGNSWLTRQPVLREIGGHLQPTLWLGFLASIYSMATALFINSLAFIWPRFGNSLIPLLRLGIAVPSFVVCVVIALVTINFQSRIIGFASVGGDSFLAYLVPACAVALYPACVMTALLRDRFRDIMDSPFFRAARASGQPLSGQFFRVLLPNSWSTLLTAWINQISLLVFSTIVVEYVFSFRGLGALLIRSIQGKDLPVISGVILLNGLFFLLVHTIGNIRIGRGSFQSSDHETRPEEVPSP